MTPEEYQAAAARTMPSKDSVKAGLHGSLGLVAELKEAAEAWGKYRECFDNPYYAPDKLKHFQKEIGDCWWMIAELATANEYDLGDVMNCMETYAAGNDPINGASQICGLYQKIFQGHRIPGPLLFQYLAQTAGDLDKKYRTLTNTEGHSYLTGIWQTNIDKLQKRYPDGFDPERSLNRSPGDI